MAADTFKLEIPTQRVKINVAEVSLSAIIIGIRDVAELFIEFFLHEELAYPVPQFHTDIWEKLTDQKKERVLLAIPREHAKTTLAKLNVVWYFLFTEHRFCVYLSNTAPIAKNACRDIINYLDSPNFVETFGAIRRIKESESEGLWIFELSMPNGTHKKCILRSAGANQQMRGINIDNQRPDIAVIDDLEDIENTASPVLQKKLDRWVFGTFMKALSKQRVKVIWLGNMLSKDSLLSRLSKRPNWNPVVYGCLITDPVDGRMIPLWPDLWSLDAIQEDFAEYRDLGLTDTWMCEMMNMPGVGTNGFNNEQFNYKPLPVPEELVTAFITIDPAFGLTSEHDKSAIVVHGILKEGPPMVVAYDVGYFSEPDMFDKALELAIYWNAWTWGIESIAAQKLLITLFEHYAAAQGIRGRVEFVKLIAGMNKHDRIKAWVASMDGGYYAIMEDDWAITQQLLAYDLQKKNQEDDLVDSCSYGPQMLENFFSLIHAQAIGQDVTRGRATTSYGMEVCRV